MKKKLILVTVVFSLIFLSGGLAFGEPQIIDTEAWLQLKASIKGKSIEASSRCGCPGMATPRCRSGFHSVGYTEVIDYVVTDAWGKDRPGPGGEIALDSHTIVENGVCCHDHIKETVCDPY